MRKVIRLHVHAQLGHGSSGVAVAPEQAVLAGRFLTQRLAEETAAGADLHIQAHSFALVTAAGLGVVSEVVPREAPVAARPARLLLLQGH
jgi:hypothetical protein